MSSSSSTARAQSGMTLIEVLVALLVISVGMLGIAALQMSSLRANQESYGRTQASVLAADILDRMRANQVGYFAGDYDVAKDGVGPAGTSARDDLQTWQSQIDDLLGSDAGGSISRDPATQVATITITWQERSRKEHSSQAVQNAAPVSFVTRSEI